MPDLPDPPLPPEPPELGRWAALLAAYFEGDSSDEPATELVAALENEPEFRRLFVEMAMQRAPLQRVCRETSDGLSENGPGSPAASEQPGCYSSSGISWELTPDSSPMPAVEPARLGTLSGKKSARSRPVVWATLAAGLLFAGYVVAISWNMLGKQPAEQLSAREDLLPSPPEGEGSGVRGRAPRVDSQSGTSVASILGSEEVEWSPRREAGLPPAIRQGERLQIDSGLVELQLKQGTTLLIEGPAEWTIDGNNAATLKRGRLVAKVPQQAIGFTVHTPAANVVDLGTEFGVQIASDETTRVVVFRGAVEVSRDATWNRSSRSEAVEHSIRLSAGDARLVTRDSIQQSSEGGCAELFSLHQRTLAGSPKPDSAVDRFLLVSAGKPVTASSYFDDNPRETFPPSNLVDGRFNDEGTDGSWAFWVGSDGDPAEATVDLQDAFAIVEIVLQNTHNRHNNDRGTQNYRLSVSADGDRFTTIDEGTLTNAKDQKVIDQHRVRLPQPISARYLKFQALSFYGIGAGLNEIQVYAEVPPTAESRQSNRPQHKSQLSPSNTGKTP